jgi:hypothetical protein
MSAELVGLMACSTIIVEGAPGTAEALTPVERDAVQLYKAKQGKGPDRTSMLPGSIDVQRASSIHEASSA